MTIGKAIANVQIYILDAFLQPVPVGVSGELYIGGVGVARGYLNRPELTAERFIPNPFDPPLTPLKKGGDKSYETFKKGVEQPSKLYKTGDLARYLPDGNIDFTDESGQSTLPSQRPSEFSYDFGYNILLTDALSMGVTLRYINSRLVQGSYGTNGVIVWSI